MSLLYYLLYMSVISSFIFLIYLGIEQITKHFFSASWHYGILKIIMIFFMIPIGKISGFFWGREAIYQYVKNHGEITRYFDLASNNLIRNSFGFFCVLTIWVIGMVSFLLWQVYCYIKFQYIISCSNKVVSKKLVNIVEFHAQKYNITRNIKIYINENINTPMLVGFLNPIILLPSHHMDNSNAQYILSHELTHYKNKDIVLKLIMLMIRTIYWFNPIVYIFSNRLDKWCEYACDEKNTVNLTKDMKKQYGLAILEAASVMPVYSSSFSTPFLLPKQDLQERLKFMLDCKKAKKKKVLASMAIGIFFIIMGFSIACMTDTFRSGSIYKNYDIKRPNIKVYETSISTGKMS